VVVLVKKNLVNDYKKCGRANGNFFPKKPHSETLAREKNFRSPN